MDVSLSNSDIEYLEEPYEPVPVSGHEWPPPVTATPTPIRDDRPLGS